jgi:hypothetical protein
MDTNQSKTRPKNPNHTKKEVVVNAHAAQTTTSEQQARSVLLPNPSES